MALRITEAKEHMVEDLDEERYCTVAQVKAQVRKVEADVKGETMAALLNSVDLDDLVRGYIVEARYWIEAPDQAGHDFEYHEEVAVYLDGNGDDQLDLAAVGFVPLLDVADVEVDGYSFDLDDDYVASRDGRLRANVTSTATYYKPADTSSGGMWNKGTQNITATLTWGYSSYPSDIVAACAKKAAALCLDFVARNDTENGDLPGGMEQVQYGDNLVIRATRGRYESNIKRMEEEARRVCLRYRVAHVSRAAL